MKILFIAPLPPPIHGQSLASKVFLDAIDREHHVKVVNTAKKKAKNRIGKFLRSFEVLKIFVSINRSKSDAELIYLTISESLLGNIKDIFTYIICIKKLSRMTIHLHGGAGFISLINKGGLLSWINAYFLRRLNSVIVLGESHKIIFRGIIPDDKIYIVPNFAEDHLFMKASEISEKFRNTNSINILFLSNLLPGKGYKELLDAFLCLNEQTKSKLILNFAGAFGSPAIENDFLKKIHGIKNIKYHGIVGGVKKKDLFGKSHIFCLPSYYAYEGQPISILEAYASGCVVVTTNHSGIRDVFTDKMNGFEVEKKSSDSIKLTLTKLVDNPSQLISIGLFNRQYADQNFRTEIYNASLKKIMRL